MINDDGQYYNNTKIGRRERMWLRREVEINEDNKIMKYKENDIEMQLGYL